MALINVLLTRLVDGLLYPFQNQPPLVGLAAMALAAAIGMRVVVRATSDHAQLAATKRALQACIFEIRLFKDDAFAMWRALGETMGHNLTYLRLSMVPVLWMLVPLALLVAQLEFHFGYGGLEPGRAALVKVRLKNSVGAPVLTAPPGIRIETTPVWIPSLREAAWRIVGEQPGDYDLIVRTGAEVSTKTVRVSRALVRRSPLRADGALLNQLRYPAEPPLPQNSQVESIAVTYPQRGVSVFGREIHWLVVFVALSMVLTWALPHSSKRLKREGRRRLEFRKSRSRQAGG